MNLTSIYKEAARRSGKDWESVRNLVHSEHLGPDLAEGEIESEFGHEQMVQILCGVVRNNRRVRNRRKNVKR